MSENWVVQNLEYTLTLWNEKLFEIWDIVSKSPTEFRDGAIWNIITKIHGGLQAIGLALLVLFFVTGVIKTCGSFAELKRPQEVFKLFIRFAIAKGLVTYSLDLLTSIFNIVQGIINTIVTTSGYDWYGKLLVPKSIVEAIESCGFLESIPLWAVTILGCLIITILSFILILHVYGRFFKLYMYVAIAPIPLSASAGEPTQGIAKQFVKSFAGVCLEGAIVILACVIFSAFASTPPNIDETASAISQTWMYIGELAFNMLILVGTIKISSQVVKEMMGI